MSTLSHLATNKIIISRKTTISGYKQAFSTVTAGIVNLQALSAEKTALIGGRMGKSFMIYTDSSLDIQEGDQLKDVNTGEKYRVQNGGVTRKTYGATDFKQVTIEQIT